MIGNSNDETNFPHKLLLTDTQVSKILKAFANDSLVNMKLSKTQLPQIVQLGGFLFGPPPIIFGSPIPIKEMTSLLNSIKDSFKKELTNTGTKKLNNDILEDAGRNIIGKKIKKGISSIERSGITLTNNELKDIIKVIKSLEKRGTLLKGTSRKFSSQEGGFLNFFRQLMAAGLPLIKNVLTL